MFFLINRAYVNLLTETDIIRVSNVKRDPVKVKSQRFVKIACKKYLYSGRKRHHFQRYKSHVDLMCHPELVSGSGIFVFTTIY